MSTEHNDLTAANREAWDCLSISFAFHYLLDQKKFADKRSSSKAKEYDAKPWQKKIASQVAEALNSHADWLGADWTSASDQECHLLDYACGTGSVTRALSTHITHATGIDISSAMLSQYTSLLSSTHPSLVLKTSVADLCSPDPQPSISGPEFHNFDIAGVALGFHHFANPATCIANLASRLKKDGVLFIVDWLPNKIAPGEHIGHAHAHPDSHDHNHNHNHVKEEETEEWKKMKKTIKTNGFTEEDMRKIFVEAGFEEFGFVVLGEKFVLEMNGKKVEKTGFIAKGRKS
ncbi:S-adenosyl-L-methionine-dependent methyltransferase [Aureobasidium pullulans]|uniref:S-adenosyl-L-methionine-dependent methyltransferase n=1 Tax=Aureobasidium pullulans TaxID=5580 RepID=A0A4S9WMA7_AURPU|nr:S-adenosyl-L-methionine-dependent methyltransferase [Aureobasidium pullulans]